LTHKFEVRNGVPLLAKFGVWFGAP